MMPGTYKTRFGLRDTVFSHQFTTPPEREVPCENCDEEGQVRLKNGKSYSCPACYGGKKITVYAKPVYEVTGPFVVTGVELCDHMCRGASDPTTHYRVLPLEKLPPRHTVYTDSDGDQRIDEEIIFGTAEEALADIQTRKNQ